VPRINLDFVVGEFAHCPVDPNPPVPRAVSANS
jgi:hypothetical protein